jgi:hypothetical protein
MRINASVTEFRAFEKLMKSLGFLRSMDVKVGYVAKKNTPRQIDGNNNASLAYLHNFGSPKGKIPARPYLAPALEATRGRCIDLMRMGLREALQGDATAEKSTLLNCGSAIQNEAKEIIRKQIGFAPLSPKTIQARRRKKTEKNPLEPFMGTHALQRTGQLLNGITVEVKER